MEVPVAPCVSLLSASGNDTKSLKTGIASTCFHHLAALAGHVHAIEFPSWPEALSACPQLCA